MFIIKHLTAKRILGGIVAHICDKYGKLVDVGANIGDSAIFSLIKGGSYLLVEGTLEYATLIETNLSHNVKTRLYTDANPPHLAKRYYTKDYEGQEDQSFLVYGGVFLGEGDLSNYQLQVLENGSAKLIDHNTTTQYFSAHSRGLVVFLLRLAVLYASFSGLVWLNAYVSGL
ncbi:hypothetical protein [Helicobacter suis]|uniref:hypothetical protein n=1 Tax=Helicobacter suis TaxID=104628 RepID=UPI0013D6A2DD|nr:hypothetical protein [Helicobacter suis]